MNKFFHKILIILYASLIIHEPHPTYAESIILSQTSLINNQDFLDCEFPHLPDHTDSVTSDTIKKIALANAKAILNNLTKIKQKLFLLLVQQQLLLQHQLVF